MEYHKKKIYPCRVAGKFYFIILVEIRFINGSDSVLMAQCFEENLSKDTRYAYIEVLDYEHGQDNELWLKFMCEISGKWRKLDG